MDLPVDYNTTPSRRRKLVREEYARRQEGQCYHCRAPLTEEPADPILRLDIQYSLFPKGFFDYPVHLHHDHRTGMTLGAVHCVCNAVLWQYHGE